MVASHAGDPQILQQRARMRLEAGEENISLLAPTKATVAARAEKKEELVLTHEEQAALESAKYEKVAAARKQFKQQHKRLLQNLAEKRRSDAAAAVEIQKQEEERVQKIKKSGLERARRRREQQQFTPGGGAFVQPPPPPGEGEGEGLALPGLDLSQMHSGLQEGVMTMGPESQPAAPSTPTGHGTAPDGLRSGSAPESGAGGSPRSTPRGSAIAAVRAVRRTGSRGKDLGSARGMSESGADGEELTEEEKVEKRRRLKETKAAKERQTKLLERMKDEAQKKAAQEGKIKQRMERRAELKKQRILAEAAERKRVQMEENQLEAHDKDTYAGKENRRREGVGAIRQPPRSESPTKRSLLRSSTDDKEGGGGEAEKTQLTPAEEEERRRKLEAQRSSVDRLYSHKKAGDDGLAPAARDFKDWKRKNNVPEDAQVFSMTGWYPCVKQALLERGWYFNPDRESFYFDLKWTLRSNELRQQDLHPWQLTNHFLKNTAITTKVGLLRSLKSLSWHTSMHHNEVFPRCYDLNNAGELLEFLEDFRCVSAESMLREVAGRCGVNPSVFSAGPLEEEQEEEKVEEVESRDGSDEEDEDVGEEEEWWSGDTKKEKKKSLCPEVPPGRAPMVQNAANLVEEKEQELVDLEESSLAKADKLMINDTVLKTAMNVIRKNTYCIDDEFLDHPTSTLDPTLTDLEWELLTVAGAGKIGHAAGAPGVSGSCDLFTPAVTPLPEVAPVAIDQFLRPKSPEPENSRQRQAASRRADRLAAARRVASDGLQAELVPLGEERLRVIVELLCTKQRQSHGQFALNGSFSGKSKNLWYVRLPRTHLPRLPVNGPAHVRTRPAIAASIFSEHIFCITRIVKPSAKSRGRGIQTFQDIDKLLNYTEVCHYPTRAPKRSLYPACHDGGADWLLWNGRTSSGAG